MKPPEEIKCGMECIRTNVSRICIKPPNGQCPRCEQLVSESLGRIQQLESRLAQVERENKAMLHDMARYTMCGSCKHFADDGKCPQKDECVYGEIGHFEWRGVCAENTEEDDNA